MTRALYLEIGGFLNLLAQGLIAPNIQEQARDLLVKVGDAMADEDGAADVEDE